jgi:hypothetical protein
MVKPPLGPAKLGYSTKTPDKPSKTDKMVLVRLKPEMTREQKKRNLIDALEKSGITVQPASQPEGEGGLE